MNIAILHPSLAAKGGAEHVVIWLADELARRGHRVTVITSDYDADFFGEPGARRFAVRTDDLGAHAYDPLKFIRAGWRLRRLLARFDVVNPHNFPAYVWAVLARVLNPRVGPIVWFCEEPMRAFYPEVCNRHLLLLQRRDAAPARDAPLRGLAYVRWRLRYWQRHWRWEVSKIMDRWAVPRLDLILTNSRFIAGHVRAIFGVDAEPCLLGVPAARFAAPAAPSAVPPGRYVLTVSRMHPEKNLRTLLQAIGVLSARGALPFERYVIVGDGPLRGDLEREARALGIDRTVDFRGFVAEPELSALYRHAALVVYLPLDETFGLVFAEAALYGRAVIAPDHGGPSEIVRDGETGLQVDPTNPEAIADRIAYAMGHPELLAQLGEAGRRYVTAELTFPRFADRFEAGVERLLATRRTRSPRAGRGIVGTSAGDVR